MEMSNRVVLTLALSLVFAGGFFLNAQADCGCLRHISMKSFCWLNGTHCSDQKDMDTSSDQKSKAEKPNPSPVKNDTKAGQGTSNNPAQDKAGY